MSPFERFGHGVIVVSDESQDFGFQVIGRREIDVTQEFTLQNAKPNFDLINPRGMFWSVGENDAMLSDGQKFGTR